MKRNKETLIPECYCGHPDMDLIHTFEGCRSDDEIYWCPNCGSILNTDTRFDEWTKEDFLIPKLITKCVIL